MTILSSDPGTTEGAYVVWDCAREKLVGCGHLCTKLLSIVVSPAG